MKTSSTIARRTARAAAGAVCALLLGACSEQDLYSQLTQQQANDMVAVLRTAHIEADKEARDGNTYAVVAPHDSFARAIEVLRANGYPRDAHDSMGQVFKKDGLVSSPLEEQARLNSALSQELANTLSNIDGVVMARVHLSLPEKDPLAEKAPPSAASVFLKVRAGTDLSGNVGSIKALVVNSIQGLSYDNVTVAIFPAEAEPARDASAGLLPTGVNLALVGAVGLGALTLVAGVAWRGGARRRAAPRSTATGSTLTVMQALPVRDRGAG